jgi:hypothetical protein
MSRAEAGPWWGWQFEATVIIGARGAVAAAIQWEVSAAAEQPDTALAVSASHRASRSLPFLAQAGAVTGSPASAAATDIRRS